MKETQQSAKEAVIRVRRQMQDLHKHYQSELNAEKKQHQQDMQFMAKNQQPSYRELLNEYTSL